MYGLDKPDKLYGLEQQKGLDQVDELTNKRVSELLNELLDKLLDELLDEN